MKLLSCKMCGSTEIIKDGNIFVCQTCGCKYSIEESPNAEIKNTILNQDTNLDITSKSIDELLKNARYAKETEEWNDVKKYYHLIVLLNPNHKEAIFYDAYSNTKLALLNKEDIQKCQSAFSTLKNCIPIVLRNHKNNLTNDFEPFIESMSYDLGRLHADTFLSHHSETNEYDAAIYPLFTALITTFKEAILKITVYNDQIYLHNCLIDFYSAVKTIKWNNGARI